MLFCQPFTSAKKLLLCLFRWRLARHGKNKGHPAWIHILPAAVFRFRGGKTYIHHMKSSCSTANFAMNSRETRGLFALLDVPGNVDGGALTLTQTKWS